MNSPQPNSNIDHKEIEKFERMAHHWWDPQGDFKPLHDINPSRVAFIERYAGDLNEKKVLDIGCGGGILSESMAARGALVKGIDMGEGPLNIAKLHRLESGLSIDYEKVSAEELADREPEQYDIVICMEMLEHIPDPQSILNATARLVKPTGSVFFSTLNRNPKSFILGIVAAEYILRLLPRGTHEYARFIRPSELNQGMSEAGLVMKHISGIRYNPLTGLCELNKDVSINYLVHGIRI